MPNPPKKFNSYPFNYHEEIVLSIESISLEGLGVGHTVKEIPVGKVDAEKKFEVHVPFVCVGEKVRARIWRNCEGYSIADLVAIISPSVQRTAPMCPLFGICSGCQYQHLDYTTQLQLKQTHLGKIYKSMGIAAAPLPTVASPLQYAYRTKLTPHYSAVKPNAPDKFPIGFLGTTQRELVDVPFCPIATPAINAILPSVRAQTSAQKEAFRLDGTLHLRQDTNQNVITDPRATCTQEVGGILYKFVAGEFFQVNLSILPHLAQKVVSQIQTPLKDSSTSCSYLIDAYCGVGFFALQAAKHCQAVAGVEVNAMAIEFARQNSTYNGLTNTIFLASKAEAIFKEVNFPPRETTVIIDPPRSGCSPQFLEQLLLLGPARIIYVACDPQTQAHDVKVLLRAGYQLKNLQAFDLFPQTKHIESLAVLESGQ